MDNYVMLNDKKYKLVEEPVKITNVTESYESKITCGSLIDFIKHNENTEIIYHAGQEFENIKGVFEKFIYKICIVSNKNVILINMEDGNRWRDTIKVSNVNNISHKEMVELMGFGFEERFRLIKR